MSRNTGTFNFAANFEGLLKAPIDGRQMVGTVADLTTPGTWNASGAVWLYNGAIVAVGSDPTPSNNGVYWLCNSTGYTSAGSWVKVGSGSGTLTGATNGLSTTGQQVKLGGTITGNTCIDGAYGLTFGCPTALDTFTARATNNICLRSESGEVCLHSNSSNICMFADNSLKLNSAGGICIVSIPFTGTTSDSLLVWNNGDKTIKCLNIATITGATAISANNGLTIANKIISLGGDLTGTTTITLCDNVLRLRSDSANAYGVADFNLNSTYANSKFGICSRDTINGIWGLSGNSTSISAYHCADGTCGSCLNISNNGLSISSKGGADKSVTFNASGFSYAGNYCSSNISNPRWIPDKNYIDKQISGCSNILKVRIQGLSAPFTMSANDDIVAVSGLTYGQELCLPSSPQCGQRITVVDVCGTALTCPIIINGLGKVINGGTCSTINTDYGSVTFVYIGYNYWSAIAFVN